MILHATHNSLQGVIEGVSCVVHALSYVWCRWVFVVPLVFVFLCVGCSAVIHLHNTNTNGHRWPTALHPTHTTRTQWHYSPPHTQHTAHKVVLRSVLCCACLVICMRVWAACKHICFDVLSKHVLWSLNTTTTTTRPAGC